jgi:hypothetical protein
VSNNTANPVIKASGAVAEFDAGKLAKSLQRSGATPDQVKKIVSRIEKDLVPGISTKKIYRKAYKLLRRLDNSLAARYKLKTAIMELGPSGFPFEKFIAAILQQRGYGTQTGVLVKGKCVSHEVDVIAEKDDQHFMVECKYHNQPGTICNVKIPLYVQSRFTDVKAGWNETEGHEVKMHQGWVVTNTRFTTDAIQYGKCAGLYLLGWEYPVGNSLNQLIESTGLYPVTCLTTLTKKEKKDLLSNKFVLCLEICDRPEILRHIGIDKSRIPGVLQEGEALCRDLPKPK